VGYWALGGSIRRSSLISPVRARALSAFSITVRQHTAIMVNLFPLLAAARGWLQKRDETTSWSTAVPTYISDASETLSATAYGYDYTTRVVSAGSMVVVSTANVTTSWTTDYLTPALTTVFTPDPTCSTAWTLIQSYDGTATFNVGWGTACVPSKYYGAAIYSPGICPSGYAIAYSVPVQTSSASGKAITETQAGCCRM
jgi:hypothetical protein